MEHSFENNILFYKEPDIVLIMAEKNVLSYIEYALRTDGESIIYTTEKLVENRRVKYVESPWTQEIIENILEQYDKRTKVFVLNDIGFSMFSGYVDIKNKLCVSKSI